MHGTMALEFSQPPVGFEKCNKPDGILCHFLPDKSMSTRAVGRLTVTRTGMKSRRFFYYISLFDYM